MAAFRSRSIAVCGFCIRTPDGPTFLCNSRCATALYSHSVSPEGLTSVGGKLTCYSIAWPISYFGAQLFPYHNKMYEQIDTKYPIDPSPTGCYLGSAGVQVG
jgi:hypothetical protein